MKEKIKLSGVPETMLQTVYARAKESNGRGAIHDAKMESPFSLWPTTMRPSQRPSSLFRTMPSPDGLRFAMAFRLLSSTHNTLTLGE